MAAGVLKYFVTIDIYFWELPHSSLGAMCLWMFYFTEWVVWETTTPGVIGYEQYNSEKAKEYRAAKLSNIST